ncbi:manganese transport protein [Caldanaerobius fijiensis DSM 17918]|uniref:Divalent metal cation transporter MntH n=2 Tax=Caldanaerobius TaxID=862261 RepID=A0A1M5C0G3_9THEO|nr:manganese transport protein [Caldanaerobius fijiensis DSM 17918]
MINNENQSGLYERLRLQPSIVCYLNKIGESIKKFQLIKYLGPAFVVSVAYIDPGNFATNISAGSAFNYSLIWVILWSNIMAIFLQIISAKLGIVTGYNLPQMCSKVFSKKVNWFLWIVAELAAIATTLAEFLGGALGLYLLFKTPLIYAGLLTGMITFLITYMEKYGQRVVELVISLLVGVICIAYGLELFLAKPDWVQIGIHTFIPTLENGGAVLIAVGMLGATVMPHVIFLHSQLVQCRNNDKNDEYRRRHLQMEKIDVIIAMNIAFIVNAAMVIVSAAIFYSKGVQVDTIEQAHESLKPLLGPMSSVAFAVALLASGFSSSAVGTMAGETVMDGFIEVKIPLLVRRLITMVPAIVIISSGINPMKALIISQVSLSFALPAAIIPLMLVTGREDIMGKFVNRPLTKLFGWLTTGIIIGLNCLLLFLTFNGGV